MHEIMSTYSNESRSASVPPPGAGDGDSVLAVLGEGLSAASVEALLGTCSLSGATPHLSHGASRGSRGDDVVPLALVWLVGDDADSDDERSRARTRACPGRHTVSSSSCEPSSSPLNDVLSCVWKNDGSANSASTLLPVLGAAPPVDDDAERAAAAGPDDGGGGVLRSSLPPTSAAIDSSVLWSGCHALSTSTSSGDVPSVGSGA